MNLASPTIIAAARHFAITQETPDRCLVLKKEASSSSLKSVLRVVDEDGSSAIAKIWYYKGIRNRLLRTLGHGNSCREWTIHCHATRQGLPVPEPLAFNLIRIGAWRVLDIMVVRDLVKSQTAMSHLKMLLASSSDSAVYNFEEALVQMTGDFLGVGITDEDHHLNNMLVDQNGKLYRIDFECAHIRQTRVQRERELGRMLGGLIRTHIYACQPTIERSVTFAQRLVKSLNPPKLSLEIAKQRILCDLERQRKHTGINTQFQPPW